MRTSYRSSSHPARAIWRGFLGRCPRCGMGQLFGTFLKLKRSCAICYETLHCYEPAHSSELAPVLLLQSVACIPVAAAILYFSSYSASVDWLNLATCVVVVFGLAIAVLQPMKGAVVGLQWAQCSRGPR